MYWTGRKKFVTHISFRLELRYWKLNLMEQQYARYYEWLSSGEHLVPSLLPLVGGIHHVESNHHDELFLNLNISIVRWKLLREEEERWMAGAIVGDSAVQRCLSKITKIGPHYNLQYVQEVLINFEMWIALWNRARLLDRVINTKCPTCLVHLFIVGVIWILYKTSGKYGI
mgnify:CR=1 FL=1